MMITLLLATNTRFCIIIMRLQEKDLILGETKEWR